MRMREPDHAHACTVIGASIQCIADLGPLFLDDVADPAEAEDRNHAHARRGHLHVERCIGVFRDALVVDDAGLIEQGERGVAIVGEVGSAVQARQRTFGGEVGAQDPGLQRVFALLIVAAPQAHVEHRAGRIAVLGSERACVELGVVEHVAVQHVDRSAGAALFTEVVGIGDLDALEPPEHASWRIAAHDHAVVA